MMFNNKKMLIMIKTIFRDIGVKKEIQTRKRAPESLEEVEVEAEEEAEEEEWTEKKQPQMYKNTNH